MASQKPIVKPVIKQEDVNEVAQLHAQYVAIKKDYESLRKPIVDALVAGAECPLNGPYVLGIITQNQPANTWKDICAAIIDALPEKHKEKAIKLMDELLTEKTPVHRLDIKVNPTWGCA